LQNHNQYCLIMPDKKQKVKELFWHSCDNFTELLNFKRITTEAYKSHIQRKVPENFTSERERISKMKDDFSDKMKTIAYPSIIYKTSLIYAVSSFEVFLNKFLTILYEEEPRALKNNTKSMTYEEILSHSSFKSLKKKMILSVLHDFFYKSIAEQFTLMNKKFGFKLDFNKSKSTIFDKSVNLETLTEIFSLRNIILHNDSIVNDIFIKNNPASRYKIGDKIVLDSEFTHNKIYYLLQMVTKLCYTILDEDKQKK
jgi:hypothetical protein